jgi:hypothetical protein
LKLDVFYLAASAAILSALQLLPFPESVTASGSLADLVVVIA